MKLATAFVEIRPDTSKFGPELQRETTQKASDVSRQLGAALAGGAFLTGAKKATDAASQLEQAVGGTAAVFGEASAGVEEFAKNAAESAGLSERAARELTSSLGGLLKGFGFTADEAAGLSVELATLGADLAATFGGQPEEAVQALGAALRGETDPLERFGIALNQTLVNQRAVELGLAATTSKVDQQAKAQATLSLITERSADAQGQFAREADTAAGQAAISAAKMENSAADLGTNLIPIYTKISETVGVLADGFGALPELVQTTVIALAGIAALTGPVTAAASAIGSLARISRSGLASGLNGAALGAYSLAGSLGAVTFGLGVAAPLLFTASTALNAYNDRKERTAKLTATLADALKAEAEGLEGEVDAVLGALILQGDFGEKLRGLGADVGVMTDAIVEQGPAVDRLRDRFGAWTSTGKSTVDALAAALQDTGLAGSDLGNELQRLAASGELSGAEMADLIRLLELEAHGYANATQAADNKAAADEAAGTAAATAAPKVEDLSDALSDSEQNAKDAADSVDLFREAVARALGPQDFEAAVDQRAQAFADFAAGVEDRAEAVEQARRRIADLQDIPVEDRPDDFARQMADAQEALQDALDETSLSLQGNSDAALRNREDLRGLVEDSVGVIESARDQGRSLDDLLMIQQGEIDMLRNLADRYPELRDEIDTYIGRIEAIPLNKATTVTVDTAEALRRIKEYAEALEAAVPGSVDAAVIDRNLQRAAARENKGYAAGGDVMDGLFTVGENGTEVMHKQGSEVSVIAGSPTPLWDAVGEDQLMTQREMRDLLRLLVSRSGGSSNEDVRRAGAMV